MKSMEKVVVTFDVFNPDTQVNTRMVKMWNEDEPAIDFVDKYLDHRRELHWTHKTDDKELKDLAPGAIIEFRGYSDDTFLDCRDVITVFYVEAEDYKNDFYRKFIRMFVEEVEVAVSSNDIPKEEIPYLEYTIDLVNRLFEKLDDFEKKLREKGDEEDEQKVSDEKKAEGSPEVE